MSKVRQAYDIYVYTQQTGVIHAADAILVEQHGLLNRFGFRYTPIYLNHPSAFSLDPVQLPLGSAPYEFDCNQGIPGILDDYLPDDWGRKVLARLVFYRDQKKINNHSCIETLKYLGNSRIGALQWIEKGATPKYSTGCQVDDLARAEQAAQHVDHPEAYSSQLDELSLIYMANAGTGVGGARPKALMYDAQGQYLAKFNRLSQDNYNNARVELACLKLAHLAGIDVFSGRVVEGINGREVLLLDRFDIDGDARKHLITVNALLKDPRSQRDAHGVFRYDDIAQLVKQYSVDVIRDLEQLVRMMLFNRGINNADTHERNFSFIHTDDGYHLAPAYDMVPTLTAGQYPVAGFGYSQYPPLCSEIKGRVFGLEKTRVSRIAEEVAEALRQWERIAEAQKVDESEAFAIARCIRI